ncbi:MAG TPA: phosphotransferase, partial [candidate division Zixibacteria bacterium]|nr:phosphotransferase [candidate division Zixibacteria bacterium]
LQRLHSAKLPNLPTFSVEEAQAQLKTLALETAQIYPVLRESIEGVWQQLETRAPAVAEKETVLVHRDFYDKQLLVGANRITLLDTDTLALGDPAVDVGNFLAHLVLRGKQNALSEKTTGEARANFLEAYRSGQQVGMSEAFQKRTVWWEAATLLRLACLYSLRPRWKKLALPLLEQSEKTLRGEDYA